MTKKLIKMTTSKKNSERSNIKILLLVAIIVAISAIGSYAWLSFDSKGSRLSLIVGNQNSLLVEIKPYQLDAVVSPIENYQDGILIEATAINNKNINGEFSFYFDVESISNELKSNVFRYQLIRSSDNFSTKTTLVTGNFMAANNNSPLTIYEENIPAGVTYKYKLYIWVQELNTDQSALQNKLFVANVMAEIAANTTSPSP